MTKPIKSIHELTRCTACRAHIRAAERPSATDCPFCGANLRSGRARFAVPGGRGSMLAASLFALSACGGGQTAGEPSTDESASTAEPAETGAYEPIEDESADEAYAPIEDESAEGADAYADEPADEMAPAPRYGLAPFRQPARVQVR